MLDPRSLPRLLRKAAIWPAILAALLLTVAMFTDYESAAHYFRAGAVLPVLSLLLALLSALLGTAAILLCREPLGKIPFPQGKALPLPAVGFLLAGAVLLLFGQADTLRYAAGLSLLLSAPYAFLQADPNARQRKATVSLLGLLPILSCILLNAYYYFDVSIEMNSPIKLALQIALLPAMLAYVGEVRFHLGRPMPRVYALLGTWLTALGSLSALALPAAFLFGRMPRADYAVGALLLATVSITQHMQVRRLLAPSLPEEPDTDAAAASPNPEDTTENGI